MDSNSRRDFSKIIALALNHHKPYHQQSEGRLSNLKKQFNTVNDSNSPSLPSLDNASFLNRRRTQAPNIDCERKLKAARNRHYQRYGQRVQENSNKLSSMSMYNPTASHMRKSYSCLKQSKNTIVGEGSASKIKITLSKYPLTDPLKRTFILSL
eukprot:TRINITY_DN657_c0_g4_i3.p1 TRINITY_DN657_c0_g4~~TRINITY_DN657_c0_g4_i3.p1  ORF type:complete len:154 (+),score=12.34 TRINITY_DN657_c0_g4_i3:86-547(+)